MSQSCGLTTAARLQQGITRGCAVPLWLLPILLAPQEVKSHNFCFVDLGRALATGLLEGTLIVWMPVPC